jgi:hypothetical protein
MISEVESIWYRAQRQGLMVETSPRASVSLRIHPGWDVFAVRWGRRVAHVTCGAAAADWVAVKKGEISQLQFHLNRIHEVGVDEGAILVAALYASDRAILKPNQQFE